MEAQTDAVTFLFNAKTQSNPENTVGLMTNAGKGYEIKQVHEIQMLIITLNSPEVFVTLTSDIGKILTALHTISLGGKANFTTGVNIAQVWDMSFPLACFLAYA
jgi:26S proteasome regulatory subunit N10